MRVLLALTLACLIAAACEKVDRNTHAQEEASPAQNEEQAQAEIRAMLDSLAAATHALDADGVDAFHLYVPKFSRVQRGQRMNAEEGQALERQYFEAVNGFKSTFSAVKIDVFGEVAIATMQYGYERQTGEETHAGSVLLTLVVVKVGEAWKIAHESLSAAEETD